MDIDKVIEASRRFDAEFEREHPKFARWWRHHSHCDSDPKWSVAPRVAYKCECYQQEYAEAKSVGIV